MNKKKPPECRNLALRATPSGQGISTYQENRDCFGHAKRVTLAMTIQWTSHFIYTPSLFPGDLGEAVGVEDFDNPTVNLDDPFAGQFGQ